MRANEQELSTWWIMGKIITCNCCAPSGIANTPHEVEMASWHIWPALPSFYTLVSARRCKFPKQYDTSISGKYKNVTRVSLLSKSYRFRPFVCQSSKKYVGECSRRKIMDLTNINSYESSLRSHIPSGKSPLSTLYRICDNICLCYLTFSTTIN